MATPGTGRPEKPVSADHPDTAAVALALRNLRHGAGLTLRELAHHANYSVATLSAAASGSSLPRWEVVHAYARGCAAPDQHIEELRLLWEQANAAHQTGRTPRNAAQSTAPPQGREPTAPTATSSRKLLGVRRPRTTPAPTPTVPCPAAAPAKATTHPRRKPARKTATPRPTFAETVVPTTTPTPRTHPPSERPPAQQFTPPPDPGDSVPALMRQAQTMGTARPPDEHGPFATALDLCTTPAQFTELLNELHSRSGLSVQDVHQHSKRARINVSRSSIKAALHGKQLPRTEVLQALLYACCCPSDEWRMWHHTRVRLKLAQLVSNEEAPMSRIKMLRTDPLLRAAVIYPAVFLLGLAHLVLSIINLLR
jgi:transcriptional regulator with XRE-family HTH domain